MDPPRTTSVKPARTVLVVEDDPLVRSVAVNHLQNCGLSVVEAATGEEAVALIRNDPRVAAVFPYVQMPGSIDGIGLARWLARSSLAGAGYGAAIAVDRSVPSGKIVVRVPV